MGFNIRKIILFKSKRASIISGFSIVVILGVMDLFINYHISFSIFYVLPVILVTWNAGYVIGFVLSFISSCFWFVDAFLSRNSFQFPISILTWDSVVRLAFFLIIAYTIHIFKIERNNARYDYLTKIPNRRYFSEILESEMLRTLRYRHAMTIVYMDVDNFKTVNDRHGHFTGDYLLKTIASTIKNNIRSSDITARLGGDEFGILLVESEEKPALLAIKKLQTELIKAMEYKDFPVTFSFGIVTFHQCLSNAREMLKLADDLLYKAKNKGKNKIIHKVIGKTRRDRPLAGNYPKRYVRRERIKSCKEYHRASGI